MRYTIVESDNSIELEEQVMGLINEGWKPLGAPTICVNESDKYHYCRMYQAMTLEEKS